MTMDSRYTMFKHHGKAPRPMLTWSGPWSTLMMLHEIEYFQCELLGGRAVTALNDKYGTQAISYDSFVVIPRLFLSSAAVGTSGRWFRCAEQRGELSEMGGEEETTGCVDIDRLI